MASSSLTLVDPPSSLSHNWIHHVFPSFHGSDVRTNFLSHVLKEFKRKGIDVFTDNDIVRSKSISPELILAINGSKIAIVLLSENYASSTWCLNELVEIMKCRKEFGQTVMPLFYEVDPTDIKKQKGYFGKVFKKTCKAKRKEEIGRWKHALTEVTQIAGYHSSNWETEAEMIEDIATDVSNKLNLSAPCSDFEGLVGMESKMKEMRPLLQVDSNEVRKIGICGPPGVGKTTIARSVFNEYSRDFQLSVFIDNIKRKYAIPTCSDDYSVKLELQKQLMSQLTYETSVSISHLGVVKDRLKDRKVLVVLDDVDHLVQVEAMAKETYWFGPGSRIIITTQDQRVLKTSGVDHIQKVNLPSYGEALQIFCMYAFGQKDPKAGFKELACEVMSLVGRLPLGLKVMESYFREMSKQDWSDALPRLRTHLDRDEEITNILKFSYDALNDEDKRLFIHIACFFDDEEVDIVEGCLEKCFLDARQGLQVLSEKSLISTGYGKTHMAKLLVQIGRQIVRKEFVNEPGKCQFLNNAIDIGEVFSDDKTGNSSVIGISLEGHGEITCTSERAFERLSNLQFLRIVRKGVNPRSLNYISHKLKVLIWPDFYMSCFPPNFNPELLVKLDMSYSKLEKLWEGIKPLRNLRWMDLSNSESLKELPNLSTATNLYDLYLNNCSSLVELPSSIGNAINLKILSLECCSSLVKLPSSIWKLVNLEILNLTRCWRLVELPSPSLSKLETEKCSKSDFSRGIENIINCLPLIASLLSNRIFHEDNSIKYHESSTDIQELDPWVGRKSRLERLGVSGSGLVSLPPLPDSLLFLDAFNCKSLERIDCSFRSPVIWLNFANCFKLNQEARDLIVHTQTYHYAICPAEEVPQCFTYRSSGSSLTVKLKQLPLLGKSTIFKACILVADEYLEFSYMGSVCCTITSGGNAFIAFHRRTRDRLLGNLFKFEFQVEAEEVTSTELVFDFEYVLDTNPMKIRECGIFQLLEVPLLSLENDDEDLKPSDIEI